MSLIVLIRLNLKSHIKGILLVLSLFASPLFAQIETSQNALVWIKAQAIIPLSNASKLTVFTELREFVFPTKTNHILLPCADYNYDINNQWNLGAGSLYFFAANPINPFEETEEFLHEFRTHLEASLKKDLAGSNLHQRLKFEQRWLEREPENIFLLRLRYRFEYRRDFYSKIKTKLQWVASLEPMWQYENVHHHIGFDQVRSALLLRGKTGERISWEVGAMHWFQQTPIAQLYFSQGILKTAVSYHFKLKNKTKP